MLSVADSTDNNHPINYVTGAAYNAPGLLTASTYGQSSSFTGILSTFSYNSRLQPVNLWSSSPTRTLMNLIYDFHVGNGDNGNVYSITNNRDIMRNQTFSYDPLNRLLSAQNAGTDCTQRLPDGHTECWGNNYVYDAWGNLNQKHVTKCSAENLNTAVNPLNRLQSYDYDAAGNMTKDNNGTNYVYDAENRISSTSGFSYVYDADGNRVQKINANTNPATGTLYWYMSSGIVGESDLLGNLQSEYVFFDGDRIARKDFPGNTAAYYFSDHLKTASVITNATGNIKSESDITRGAANSSSSTTTPTTTNSPAQNVVELGVPTMSRETVLKMIDELAPPSERGKAISQLAGFDYIDVVNGTADISAANYENVLIQIHGSTSAPGDVAVVLDWKRKACASSKESTESVATPPR